MLTDTQLLVTIIILGALIVSAVIIAGILYLQQIQDSEYVYKIFHEGSPADQFTRRALLAIVLLLSFIAYLLYDHTVLLPQRTARALQEAKTVMDKAEMERWKAASDAESAAFDAQLKQTIKNVDAYCKKHPSDIAFCGAPARKQNKPSSEKAEHDIGVYRDEHGTLHFYDTTAKKNLKEADGQ